MTSSRILLTLALAALLAWPASAGGDLVAQLRTPRLDATDATASGPLAALEDTKGTGTMALDAALVNVTVEEERADLLVAEEVVSDYTVQPAQQAAYADVRGASTLMRSHHYVDVFPLDGRPAPTLDPGRACVSLVPSSQPEVRAWEPKSSEIRGRHREEAPTGDALSWDAGRCPGAGWAVQGDFLVVLYEADVTLNGTTYRSGAEETPTGPSSPLPFNATSSMTLRYVYLTVHGGRLQAGPEATPFLASADVRARHLAFDGATGTAPALGDARLDHERLELAGDLLAHATAGAAGLDVTVNGRLESGAIAGHSVAVATGGGPGGSAWLLALLAVPLVVGGVAWRAGPERRLARLGRLSLLGRDAEVAERSRRLQRHPDLWHEASALRIEALARTGRRDEALAEARLLPGWEGAVAAAYVHAQAGDAAQAVEALRPWRARQPAELRAVLLQPAFAGVRSHPDALPWCEAPEGGDA